MERLPSLPFELAPSIQATQEGTIGLRGLLHAEGADVLLDVRPIHPLGEGEVETHRFPLSALSAVEFKTGWFSSRLILRPRRLGAFDALPAFEPEALALRVRRADRALASRWATEISLALLDRSEP